MDRSVVLTLTNELQRLKIKYNNPEVSEAIDAALAKFTKPAETYPSQLAEVEIPKPKKEPEPKHEKPIEEKEEKHVRHQTFHKTNVRTKTKKGR